MRPPSSRRVVLTAAAAAITGPWRAPAETLQRPEQEVGALELKLEAELQEMLDSWGTPGSLLSAAQTEAVDAVVRALEKLRGRQQRAGWGQSDMRYDLPMIGAWDVLYSSAPDYAAADRDAPRLVSARQWVYGPGSGGLAAECVYAARASSPAAGDLLLVRAGNVTKLDGPRLRLDLAPSSRAYSLSYVRLESSRLQAANGSWRPGVHEKSHGPSALSERPALPVRAPHVLSPLACVRRRSAAPAARTRAVPQQRA